MKFTKEIKPGNTIIWKRTPRDPLTEEELKQLIEMPIAKIKVLPTEEKRLWFYNKIEEIKRKFTEIKSIILIERGYFLRDSFEQFRTTTDLDLRGELKVHFIDELAQDAGGLVREWFSIIVEEVLNPNFGLFKKANIPELSYIINPDSGKIHSNYLEYYFFVGQVFGKAVYDRVPVKGYLNKTLLKKILGLQLKTEDLADFDTELWKSIKFIKETSLNIESEVGTSFTITKKDFLTGKDEVIELKAKGKEIALRDSNKAEFCQLFAEYYLEESVKQQLTTFLNGFYALVPKEVISVLNVDEFEFFICGDPAIDLEDWINNTTYKEYYSKDHVVVQWFWQILGKLTEEEKRQFLQFCTGSTRVPAEGFKGLLSNGGKVCSFCVEPKDYTNPDTSFIVAHTCFNRIEIPCYPNFQIMEKNMRSIITNPQCSNFTFA